jgi:hypothetical protein
MKIELPLRTVSALNAREHHMKRARRVKAECQAVAWAIRVEFGVRTAEYRPAPPLVVTLTRIAPSNGIDAGDNLPSSLKGCRDQVAAWLGVDDANPIVQYRYAQERGAWGVRIELEPAA